MGRRNTTVQSWFVLDIKRGEYHAAREPEPTPKTGAGDSTICSRLNPEGPWPGPSGQGPAFIRSGRPEEKSIEVARPRELRRTGYSPGRGPAPSQFRAFTIWRDTWVFPTWAGEKPGSSWEWAGLAFSALFRVCCFSPDNKFLVTAIGTSRPLDGLADGG